MQFRTNIKVKTALAAIHWWVFYV